MKLVRIAREQWDVLAVLDHRDHCQVLEFIDGLAPNYEAAKKAMLYQLEVILPKTGPFPEHPDFEVAGQRTFRVAPTAEGTEAARRFLL